MAYVADFTLFVCTSNQTTWIANQHLISYIGMETFQLYGGKWFSPNWRCWSRQPDNFEWVNILIV